MIQEVLHVASVEMQLTAAVSFLTILQEESMSVHTYAHSFLQIILLHLEHRDTGQVHVYLITLLFMANGCGSFAIYRADENSWGSSKKCPEREHTRAFSGVFFP